MNQNLMNDFLTLPLINPKNFSQQELKEITANYHYAMLAATGIPGKTPDEILKKMAELKVIVDSFDNNLLSTITNEQFLEISNIYNSYLSASMDPKQTHLKFDASQEQQISEANQVTQKAIMLYHKIAQIGRIGGIINTSYNEQIRLTPYAKEEPNFQKKSQAPSNNPFANFAP